MNINKMSLLEATFIRAYVLAMKRQFPVLDLVIELMNPDGLAVKDVVHATNLAQALQNIGGTFEEAVQALRLKHNFFERPPRRDPTPTLHELTELFTLSFFKVMKSTDHVKLDAGWFSGEPGSFHKNFVAHMLDPDSGPIDAIYKKMTDQLLLDNWSIAALFGKDLEGTQNHWMLPEDTLQPYGDEDDDEDYEDEEHEDYEDDYDEDGD